MPFASAKSTLPTLALVAVAFAAGPASAFEPKTGAAPFRVPEGLSIPDLEVGPSLVTYEMGASPAAALPADVQRFLGDHGRSGKSDGTRAAGARTSSRAPAFRCCRDAATASRAPRPG